MDDTVPTVDDAPSIVSASEGRPSSCGESSEGEEAEWNASRLLAWDGRGCGLTAGLPCSNVRGVDSACAGDCTTARTKGRRSLRGPQAQSWPLCAVCVLSSERSGQVWGRSHKDWNAMRGTGAADAEH